MALNIKWHITSLYVNLALVFQCYYTIPQLRSTADVTMMATEVNKELAYYAIKPSPEAHIDMILCEMFLKSIDLTPQ